MDISKHMNKLAVCSWSLQPETPARLAEDLDVLGIRRVQLALDPLRERPEVWGNCIPNLAEHGIEVASGMMTAVGEDYSTIDSIRVRADRNLFAVS